MLKSKWLIALLCFVCLGGTGWGIPNMAAQEVRVNQKKIEREREKKHKQAVKDYEKAVKRHKDMQTKSTKASMKKTKKESAKVTPVNR